MSEALDSLGANASALSIDEQYIKAIYGAACGPWGAQILYYRNTHPNRAIRITIRHHWVYENETHEDPPYDVVLAPNLNGGQTPTEKDALMGCPIPGPTSQRFHWDMVKAVWA
jgi:hypothetical protein